MSEVRLHHQGSGPTSFENVPIGPFAWLQLSCALRCMLLEPTPGESGEFNR